MSIKPFIPKDNQELPDWYGCTITLVTGKKIELELASHRLGEKLFEVATKEDEWKWFPIENILQVEFDKRFSKIVDIKNKEKNNAER
jgi:hypothetical protein